MKGIVLSIKRPSRTAWRRSFSPGDFIAFLKRGSVTLAFVLLLLLGLVFGAVYCKKADEGLIRSMDFLFTTNLEARLSHSVIATFCACFASDFLFLAAAYLFGTAPWGLPFELALVLFKGFGTGLTAAYLVITHALAGLGFYLLVLLPGTFVFSVALVSFSDRAFRFSALAFKRAVGKNLSEYSPREELKRYSTRFLFALIAAFFASLLDTVLWSLFAGTFNF